jgi:hypothetical protein
VVLLGTMATHHPSETLVYDVRGMRFEGKRDTNEGFSRAYRKQYLNA